MNDNIRNEFSHHGLEILKLAVLDVLYDIHVSGQSLKFHFQRDICDRLGIKLLTKREDDVKYDYLIHGILIRLRAEKYATHIHDNDAPANQVDQWQITKQGIDVIKG